MNWDDIRHFLALSRTGKLTAAGARLRVDHTTVRRRIISLERILGEQLFVRSPRGYSLTEAGKRLVAHAEEIESRILVAQGEFDAGRPTLSGVVRIGAPEGLGRYVIADAAAELATSHPELEIQLTAAPRIMNLADREVDVAISVSRPTTGRLKVRKITDYGLQLYAHRDYLARVGAIASIGDLKRVRGIGYIPEQIYDEELNYLPQIREDLKPHLTSSSINVQLGLTLGAKGVCILPAFMARHHAELVRILPNDIDIVRSFWIVTPEDLGRIEKIRAVAEHVALRVREAIGAAHAAADGSA